MTCSGQLPQAGCRACECYESASCQSGHCDACSVAVSADLTPNGCPQDDVSRASGDQPRRRRQGWGQGLAKLRSAPSEDITSPSVPAAAAEAIAAELLHSQVW